MEYLYHVGDDDQVIGYIDREQVHHPPFPIHRAVSIITITPNRQLLLQRRARWKNVYPGALDIHGGNLKYPHTPNIIPENPLERKQIYEKSGLAEFREEVYLDIPIHEFHWIVPHPIDYFKVRIPGINAENKAIFLVFLDQSNIERIQQKNQELKKFWDKIYHSVSKQLKISKTALCYHASQNNGHRLRIQIRKELSQIVGANKIEYFEIEGFTTNPLEKILQHYKTHPEDFADGFYSIFDTSRNQVPEAQYYPEFISQAMEKLWRQKGC